MSRNNIVFIVTVLLLLPSISTAKSCKKYHSCAEVIADYPDGRYGSRR